MLITRNFIQKYININKISDLEITDALNSLGFEVEKYQNLENLNSNIVLGKVVKLEKISESDKLSKVEVQISSSKIMHIVCGANNLIKNMYVILALPDAILANGMKIKKRKILNHISEGMICSYSEIGYSHLENKKLEKGIIHVRSNIINDNFLGSKEILKILKIEDTIFEYDITFNRNYGFSTLEIVKELAYYFKLTMNDEKKIALKSSGINKVIIKNEVPKIIKNIAYIKISINNNDTDGYKLDDIFSHEVKYLNIIESGINALKELASLKYAQPIILLDAKKITSNLTISNSLIYKDYQVTKKDLVITCDKNFIELIGIFKNEHYKINNKTKEIIAIALNIDPDYIRNNYLKHNQDNFDCQRYTRVPSTANIENALADFVKLLEQSKLLKSYCDIKSQHPTQLMTRKIITITSEKASQLIGVEIDDKLIKNLLTPLGFIVIKNKNILSVTIPLFRTSLLEPDDLYEEILRLFGYDKIPSKPLLLHMNYKTKNPENEFSNILENLFVNNGFSEVKTFSLVSEQELKLANYFNYKNPHFLIKPLSDDRSVMRLSLLPSLIETVGYNHSRNIYDTKIYTKEKIYHNDDLSNNHFAAISGDKILEHKISDSQITNSFYYFKGLLNSFIEKLNLNIDKLNFKTNFNDQFFNKYKSASVYYDNKHIGFIGAIHPSILLPFNIKTDVYGLEIVLEPIYQIAKNNNNTIFVKEKPKFNFIKRDISIIIKDQSYSDILNAIKTDIKYLYKVKVIDYYIGAEIPKNSYSLTISCIFYDKNKQLTDDIIKLEFNKLISKIKNLRLQIRT